MEQFEDKNTTIDYINELWDRFGSNSIKPDESKVSDQAYIARSIYLYRRYLNLDDYLKDAYPKSGISGITIEDERTLKGLWNYFETLTPEELSDEMLKSIKGA